MPPRPDIEALLDDWQALGWPFRERPHLLRRLAGGQYNESFLLSGDGRTCVLRLGAAARGAPGIDREREGRLLTAAATCGLAPAVLHLDLERDLLLTAVVAGHHLAPAELGGAARAALLERVMQIHALAVDVAALDYRAHFLALGRLAGAVDAALPLEIERQLSCLEAGTDCCIVHHDPGPRNVLFVQGRPVFIDWEYAAAGLAAFDFAALVCDWQLPAGWVSECSGVPRARLDDACALYAVLCDWWTKA
ncbi:MAG: phosphotransferase [Gammaproteobacteria bacterium]